MNKVNSPNKNNNKKSSRIAKPYVAKSDDSKLVPKPQGYNHILTSPKNRILLKLLGPPRRDGKYGEKDGPLDNPALQKLMVEDVKIGPLNNIKGLIKAVESLRMVMADIEKEQNQLYKKLGHVGMRVVRYQRPTPKIPIGAPNRPISNHSWGTAIDLKIEGLLDIRNDNMTQKGLILLAPIFNRHKWYWGKSFPTEDSMHFEVSQELILSWAKSGQLGPDAMKIANKPGLITAGKRTTKPAAKAVQIRAQQATSSKVVQNQIILKRGNKGAAVYILQMKLNHTGALPKLVPDKSFGGETEKAVKDFQRRNGLPANGIVDTKTDEALSSWRISVPAYFDMGVRKIRGLIHK